MRRPGLALIGSVVLHAGVVALAFVSWPRMAPEAVVSTVPVSIISSETILAAAPDNPDDELVEEASEEAPEAPEEAPPELTPPEPAPPQARPPERAPTPTPAPSPSRQTPPRPAETRPPDPGLDLEALAGPVRQPQRRPPTGEQGAGQAPRATGAEAAMFGRQVTPHWIVACELQGMEDMIVEVRVTISDRGRITAGPTLSRTQQGATWRVAADSVLRAIRAAEPYDVPSGYTTREVPFRFETSSMCGGR